MIKPFDLLISFNTNFESSASADPYVTLEVKIANMPLRQVSINPRNCNLGTPTGTWVWR